MENDHLLDEKKYSLPPMVGDISAGKITWKRMDEIDYELLGYFLACHLMVEHYMDEYLKTTHPGLDWDSAKPTFAQRTALLGNLQIEDQFNCIPTIKYMNGLRNKISHRIDHKLDANSLLPLAQFITKMSEGRMEIGEPRDTIDMFAMLCCSFFAGNISREVRKTNHTRPATSRP
jgi:hypothetical protein